MVMFPCGNTSANEGELKAAIVLGSGIILKEEIESGFVEKLTLIGFVLHRFKFAKWAFLKWGYT
jgi:hypothetical protein